MLIRAGIRGGGWGDGADALGFSNSPHGYCFWDIVFAVSVDAGFLVGVFCWASGIADFHSLVALASYIFFSRPFGCCQELGFSLDRGCVRRNPFRRACLRFDIAFVVVLLDIRATRE